MLCFFDQAIADTWTHVFNQVDEKLEEKRNNVAKLRSVTRWESRLALQAFLEHDNLHILDSKRFVF